MFEMFIRFQNVVDDNPEQLVKHEKFVFFLLNSLYIVGMDVNDVLSAVSFRESNVSVETDWLDVDVMFPYHAGDSCAPTAYPSSSELVFGVTLHVG